MQEAKWSRRNFGATVLGTAASMMLPRTWAQDGDRIVLGQSCAMSGPNAQLGLQYHQGAKLYFDRVNAAGGIGGRKIELRVLDDGYEPERCAANTQQLISQGVFALFGYVGTPTSSAALPLVERSRIPFFAPLTGAEVTRQSKLSGLVFNVRASYADETALIVRQLTQLGLNKVAVFYQNDDYGRSGLEGIKAALAQRGLAPVGTATVERNSVDVAKAVATLVPLAPHAIVQISTYSASAAFVRAARKAVYGGQFMNVSFVGTQALTKALGNEAEGVVVSQVMPSPFKSSQPMTRKYSEALRAAGDADGANYSSLEGFFSAQVFVEGLRQASARGGISRDSLVAALKGMDGERIDGFALDFHSRQASHRFVELSMLTGSGKVVV